MVNCVTENVHDDLSCVLLSDHVKDEVSRVMEICS